MRSEALIIRKDWRVYYQVALLFTLVILVVVLFVEPRGAWNKEATSAVLWGAAFGVCQMCMAMERDHGTMDHLLLALPIRPLNMVLAKYGSVYSMTLFMVHIPGLFIGSRRDLFTADATALFAATVCATPSVLFETPGVQMLPVWMFLAYFALPAGSLTWFIPLAYIDPILNHPQRVALAALLASPAIAILSSIYYSRKSYK